VWVPLRRRRNPRTYIHTTSGATHRGLFIHATIGATSTGRCSMPASCMKNNLQDVLFLDLILVYICLLALFCLLSIYECNIYKIVSDFSELVISCMYTCIVVLKLVFYFSSIIFSCKYHTGSNMSAPGSV
jgi:L-asparagine transporter-like permease